MNKLKWLIVVVVVSIIITLFLIFSFGDFTKPSVNTSPSITPTTRPFPADQLFITAIIPADTSRSYLPVQPIQITFTQAVDVKDFMFTVSPPVETLVYTGSAPNSILVSPKTIWGKGLTTITVLAETKSVVDNLLKNSQSYTLHIAVPTIPEGKGAY